ncbi:MAG: DUF4157 domain-containing protein [Burkholderiales bacterium]|nr:DUF4157 domain-containing protein [Burkholderiales bacterium]
MNATRQIVPTSSSSAARTAFAPSTAGRALAADDRAYFEDRYDTDFSQVRLHTDAPAAALADAIGAKAFAAGADIAFGPGRYAPGDARGRELLAHELAHVAQQRAGGSAGVASAEAGARTAASHVAAGGAVPATMLGGAPTGVYADDKDEVPPKAASLPPLQLTPPAIDWMKMRDPYTSRGLPFKLRDADSIDAEWQRSSHLLDTLGIDDRFKLGFITKQWLLNKGLSFQLDSMNARDHPNFMDRSNLDWKNAHPGMWQTPMIPIFDLDWFRSSGSGKSP